MVNKRASERANERDIDATFSKRRGKTTSRVLLLKGDIAFRKAIRELAREIANWQFSLIKINGKIVVAPRELYKISFARKNHIFHELFTTSFAAYIMVSLFSSMCISSFLNIMQCTADWYAVSYSVIFYFFLFVLFFVSYSFYFFFAFHFYVVHARVSSFLTQHVSLLMKLLITRKDRINFISKTGLSKRAIPPIIFIQISQLHYSEYSRLN